jgi:hypothetical protein
MGVWPANHNTLVQSEFNHGDQPEILVCRDQATGEAFWQVGGGVD